MEVILLILIATIAISTVLNVLLKRFDIPTVIGYIFTGLITMQMFDFGIDSQETLSHLAEFGIVFLMFTIGLEFSISHMKSMKREVFVYGTMQMLFSGIIFTTIASVWFGLEIKSAIVIGFALALSSTAIVLKVLNERGEIHSGYGRVAVGILIFQDLAVIPILLMISIFTSKNSSVFELLFSTLVSAIVVFLILFVVGKFFIERFFDWVIASNSEEIFLGSVLLIVIASSMVAELFGFSFSLGAFIAGMTIAETKYRYRIEADLVPFRDILLGVFFVTIGMQIDPNVAIDYWWQIIALSIGIMLLKGIILFIILKFFMQNRTAIKSSLALMQVGEFALAVFALAFNNSLISSQINQILIMSVVFSMILTPFILNNIKSLADIFFKEPEKLRERALKSVGYRDHVIVCGYGAIGKKLVKKLKAKNILYVILEHDIKLVDNAIKNGEESIFLANAGRKGVLEHFCIRNSKAVVVTINNEHQMRLICENINSFNLDINTIVKVKNSSEAKVLEGLNIKNIVVTQDIISDILVEKVEESKVKEV